MRRRTTTQKLNTAITNNMLAISKAEKYSKTTQKTDVIAPETLKDSLDFLCETIFSDSIGWYFERDHRTGSYIVECSRMDGSVDFIITVYLDVCSGINGEDIEKALLFMDEE